MKLQSATNKLLLVSSVLLIFGAGYKLGEYKTGRVSSEQPRNFSVSNLDEGNKDNLDFSLFWQAWNALDENYVDKDKLDPMTLYYGAIKGMVASVNDSYTFFLTPEENKQSKDDLKGVFFGIGAELGLENNHIVIVTPLKDSPAEKAGVKAGDVVLKVDGESTAEWTLQQAVNEIRGPKGEAVVLTMGRRDKEVDISIVRDEINIPFVELTFEGNVAIITLTRFGEPTDRLWDQSVRQILARKKAGTLDGIVLDMRGNPGGFLDSAVHIASEFVNKGDLIVKQEYADRDPEIYNAMTQGQLTDVPVVILINEGSASASEIVAGALRDHKKATLVGQNSFGKGTVQQALDLKDNAGIHVTISKWVLPGGDWINETGIKPDIEIENVIEEGNTLTREKDKQLTTAVDVLLHKYTPDETKDTSESNN